MPDGLPPIMTNLASKQKRRGVRDRRDRVGGSVEADAGEAAFLAHRRAIHVTFVS